MSLAVQDPEVGGGLQSGAHLSQCRIRRLGEVYNQVHTSRSAGSGGWGRSTIRCTPLAVQDPEVGGGLQSGAHLSQCRIRRLGEVYNQVHTSRSAGSGGWGRSTIRCTPLAVQDPEVGGGLQSGAHLSQCRIRRLGEVYNQVHTSRSAGSGGWGRSTIRCTPFMHVLLRGIPSFKR